jgi:hypothetical protein
MRTPFGSIPNGFSKPARAACVIALPFKSAQGRCSMFPQCTRQLGRREALDSVFEEYRADVGQQHRTARVVLRGLGAGQRQRRCSCQLRPPLASLIGDGDQRPPVVLRPIV